MKKIFLVLLVVIFNLYAKQLSAQINMDCNGYVGITIPSNSSYALTTTNFFLSNGSYTGIIINNTPNNGYTKSIWPSSDNCGYLGLSDKRFQYVYCYSLVQGSDKRLKENVRDINNALNIVLQLKGVKYDFKKQVFYTDSVIKDSKIKSKLELERKNKVGFLAQDVQKVLPEVVNYNDSTDSYGIEYTSIIPVLVEAIKEQQVIIESLQANITDLKKQINNNTVKSAPINNNSTEVNILYQNTPNPFSQTTTIEYFLTDNVQKALICIYDMNGVQLKCIPLNTIGYGNLVINGNEFRAGMYMYSLIADGQLIDSKRMVLTD